VTVSKISIRFFLCLAAMAAASAASAGPLVQLHQAPPFNKANARLPKIVSPATPATARINNAFDVLDARWSGFMRSCPKDGDTGRTIKVTMTGPQFFSVVVNDSESCGGAYPDVSTLALVYDLSTGRPVDWKAAIGPRAALSVSADNTVDGTRTGNFASAPLQALYLKSLRTTIKDKAWWEQCHEVFDDPLSFVAWPDAKTHALVLEPTLVHAVQACAEDGSIGVDDLQKIGASMKLIEALR
jgi:hypothetical protein